MTEIKAVDGIVDFIARQNPDKVVAFKTSEATQKTVYDLVFKKKNPSLTESENAGPEYYLMLEPMGY